MENKINTQQALFFSFLKNKPRKQKKFLFNNDVNKNEAIDIIYQMSAYNWIQNRIY